MATDRDNDKIASHHVHQPEQPAVGHIHHDVLDAPEGVVRLGHVVDEQEKARDRLDDEPGERDEADGVKNVDVLRDQVSREMGPHELLEPDPDFDPVLYVFPHNAIL